jgi:hypothetical protein
MASPTCSIPAPCEAEACVTVGATFGVVGAVGVVEGALAGGAAGAVVVLLLTVLFLDWFMKIVELLAD